jgi:putative ABC transport system permease protein
VLRHESSLCDRKAETIRNLDGASKFTLELHATMNDLRFALRQLRQSPGFAALALLTLALGIGACTAIFTVVNSVILRPLEYPESERLMIIRETNLPQFPEFSMSPGNYRDYSQAEAFESMFLSMGATYNLVGRGEPVRVSAQRATGKFFEVLRVQPALGRGFTTENDTRGKHLVVVLSYGFWQKQFGGSPDVIGQTLLLNNEPHTVIGVMAQTFRRGSTTDLWAPISHSTRRNGGSVARTI